LLFYAGDLHGFILGNKLGVFVLAVSRRPTIVGERPLLGYKCAWHEPARQATLHSARPVLCSRRDKTGWWEQVGVNVCFHPTITVTVRRHRQKLAAAGNTPLASQLEDSIRFHAVGSAITVRYCNGDGDVETGKRTVAPLFGRNGDGDGVV